MTTSQIVAGVLTLVGSLAGFVVGLVVEYRLRRRGEVVREVKAWIDGTTWDPSEQSIPSESRVFQMRFFNDKDINISLWDVRAECFREGKLVKAYRLSRGTGDNTVLTPWVTRIDLESRKSVFMSLNLYASAEELSLLKSADRLQFVATTIPGGKKMRKSLPKWDPLETQDDIE